MKTLINKMVIVAALAVSGTMIAGQAHADCLYAGSTYTCEKNDNPAPTRAAPEVDVPSDNEFDGRDVAD